MWHCLSPWSWWIEHPTSSFPGEVGRVEYNNPVHVSISIQFMTSSVVRFRFTAEGWIRSIRPEALLNITGPAKVSGNCVTHWSSVIFFMCTNTPRCNDSTWLIEINSPFILNLLDQFTRSVHTRLSFAQFIVQFYNYWWNGTNQRELI